MVRVRVSNPNPNPNPNPGLGFGLGLGKKSAADFFPNSNPNPNPGLGLGAIPMAELFRRGLRLGPLGSDQVRGGRRRSPPNAISPRNKKIPPRNPPRTRRTAAEQICSAADPIGSAADSRNFRRRNAMKRVRASPPQGYSESVRRGLLRTIPRLTTVPRNNSAANNRAAEPFRG